MRTAPIVGRAAWFGPRRFGWGLGPVSREGWIATAVFVGLLRLLKHRPGVPTWARSALVLAFAVLVVLKGTAPGGRRARAELDALVSGEGQVAATVSVLRRTGRS